MSDADSDLKSKTLKSMDELYLGTSELILLEESSHTRFWTRAVFWLAHAVVTVDGIYFDKDNTRATIVPISPATEQLVSDEGLKQVLAHATIPLLVGMLKMSDIKVTNSGDKEVTTKKFCNLERGCRAIVQEDERERQARGEPRREWPGKPQEVGACTRRRRRLTTSGRSFRARNRSCASSRSRAHRGHHEDRRSRCRARDVPVAR